MGAIDDHIPRDPQRQLDRDKNNPQPALRQRQLCGLTIFWGLRPSGPDRWTDGWFYNPNDGKTYNIVLREIILVQAPNQRAVRRTARLAGKQSAMEQFHAKLSCALALPPPPDAEVPAARGRGSRIQEGAPVEITWPNLLIPQRGEEGAHEPSEDASVWPNEATAANDEAASARSSYASDRGRKQPNWREILTPFQRKPESNCLGSCENTFVLQRSTVVG
jgi:hypothetical protein